jgi:hypothetical protein
VEQGLNLRIEPWGRVEGTLRVGGRPLAHETIVAELDDLRIDSSSLHIENQNRAQTDEQGHFVIDRLSRGEARVWWQPERHGARKPPERFYRPAFVDVRPGMTTHLDLVQEGWPSLRGRIIVEIEKSKNRKGSARGCG